MKITGYYDSAASRLARQRAEAADSLSRKGRGVSASEKDAAVIDNISHNVYDALDEFLYLQGEDRIESFNALAQEDKEKFLKIVSKMRKSNMISDEKLDVEGVSEDRSMRRYLSEYDSGIPKNYSENGDAIPLS